MRHQLCALPVQVGHLRHFVRLEQRLPERVQLPGRGLHGGLQPIVRSLSLPLGSMPLDVHVERGLRGGQ